MAGPVFIDSLQAAMNSFRVEIPAIVAPMLQALRTEVDLGMHCLNGAAPVEIRQHI